MVVEPQGKMEKHVKSVKWFELYENNLIIIEVKYMRKLVSYRLKSYKKKTEKIK